MNWVVWRQHRIEALLAVILLVFFVGLLVISGVQLAAGAANLEAGPFARLVDSFMSAILTPMQFLPLLVGVFIGAPLVARERETGTFRLAWTQGITRQRWLWAEIALVGGSVLVVFSLMAAVSGWWNQPVNALLGPFRNFDTQGIVYVAYSLFALALGIAAGALLGKTVPAMALTIPLFLVVRFGVITLRQYFLPPLQAAWNLAGSSPRLQDWVLNQFLTDRAGSRIAESAVVQMCPSSFQSLKGGSDACLQANGILQVSIYQPASRFWTFQGIESAIFLALTAGLVLLTFWWLKHRVE